MKTMNVNGLVGGCLLSAALLFSCTKAEEADSQNQIEDKKPSAWTEEELQPREGEVTEDGRPVVMVFGATVDYSPKQEQPSEAAPEEEGEYEGDGEQAAEDSKSHLGDLVVDGDDKYYPNLWSVGDRVNINGESTNALQEANITGEGKRARFPMAKWVEKYGDYYYVGYPEAAFDFSEGTATVTLPATQTYLSGTYDPAAFIMLGKSEEEAVVFYPQVAPFRITIPGSYASTIKKVRLESVNGEPMSGTFSTDYNNASATFAAVSANAYVEMNTPNIAFGSTVFFVLPAKTYARGIRIRVTTADNKEMVFSNTKNITISVGSMTALTSPNYTPTVPQSTPTLAEITPSSFYVQWASAQSANDYNKRWQIQVYTNEACTGDPLRTVNIYPKPGCWTTSTTPLRCVVGRMTPGTTYYVKVKDVGNDNINATPASITLSSSLTPVRMPAEISDTGVVLAEDFSEMGWGSSSYNGVSCGGFYPTASVNADNISQRPFSHMTSTDNSTFLTSSMEWSYSWDRFNTAFNTSRISDWLYYGDVYVKPGYAKLGTESTSGYLLTSPFSLADGMTAVVSVTVKAAKYSDASDETWTVAVLKGVRDAYSAGSTSKDHFKREAASLPWPATTDATLYKTLTIDSKEWQTKTVTDLYVSDGDRLVFGFPQGADPGSTGAARINLSALSVKVTELTDDMIIRDATSLDAFRGAIADAVGASESTDITGRVVADFSASSIASSWVPIEGYTGTLDGNGKTITGLTKPFFGNLQGTVQNLTLNSTIEETANDVQGAAIFARTLTGGTISGCTSKGGVTYSPATAVTGTNITRYVAGLVASVKGNSTVTNCYNYASISIPDNSVTHDMTLEVGGLMGRLDNTEGGTISYLHNVYDSDVDANSGKVSVSVHHADASIAAHECRVGGVIGYVSSAATAISYCTNSGTVEYAGESYGSLKVGGLVGYARQGVSNAQNTGSIAISDAASVTSGYLALGGLIGYYNNSGSLSVSSNAGPVSNEADNTDASSDIYVGGLIGKSERPISTCYNNGTVNNEGDSSQNICVGGLVGCSSAITMTTSYNTKGVANAGTATNMVAMGGLVGFATGANNLYGTSSSATNYNNAAIVEKSSSDKIVVGGVVGYADNASTDLAYCQNRSDGVIMLGKDAADCTHGTVYVGGVLACTSASTQFDYASNAGDIVFNRLNITGQVFAGGVHGAFTASGKQTITGCVNSGKIMTKANVSDTHLNSSTSSPSWSFFGGISAVGVTNATQKLYAFGDMKKTFSSCTNTGNISIFAQLRSCIGGVLARSEICPEDGNVCTATIRFKKHGGINDGGTTNDYYRSLCGGVVGYCPVATLSALKYYGTLNTYESSPFAYTGGIVGLTKVNTSFSNCKVGDTIRAAGGATGSAGLFCHNEGSNTYTFTNCVLKTGTKIYYASTTATTVTDANKTIEWFVANTSGSLSGSLPSIGSIDD